MNLKSDSDTSIEISSVSRRSYLEVVCAEKIGNLCNASINSVSRLRILSVLIVILIFPLLAIGEPIEFKLGASIPLSGDLAYIGKEIVRGLELGAADLSSENIKFKIIVEDDSFQRKNALSAAQKLIRVDKVNAIVSLWEMCEIIAPVAEQNRIPHFAIRWNPHIAERYSYTMTVESTYLSYVQSLVELLKFKGIKTAALILEEAEGWVLGAEKLKELLITNNIKLVSEVKYLTSDLDFQTTVFKALSHKPEMILLLSNPPHVVSIIKKIKELNPRQNFTGYFELLDDPTIVEGMPFVAQLQPEKWFKEKYETRYHQKIKSRAPQSYDIISLIADAYKKQGKDLTGADIVSHISRIKDLPGASGALNAHGTRTIEMNCVWKIVRDGEFEMFVPDR